MPGLPKEVRSDSLVDLSGARIFVYRGRCDRVQPVNLPLNFIFLSPPEGGLDLVTNRQGAIIIIFIFW